MLGRLDSETRHVHPQVDGPWLDLLSPNLTRAGYRDHLMVVHGFEAPVEAAVALTPNVRSVLRLRERARSGSIAQDLLALGLSPQKVAHLPYCAHIEPFQDPAEALAWLYVVERATLLHAAILRQVAARLGAIPSAYLSAYEGVVGARWLGLGHALDTVATTPEMAARIVGAAHDAFACQRDWYHGESALARGA